MTGKTDKARQNGLDAFATAKSVLKDVGWDPQETDFEGQLKVDFSKSAIPISDAEINIKIDYERLVCYFNFKDIAPKKHIDQVTKFSTLANFGLIIGNFEVILDTGQVRFKSSLDFTGIKVQERLVKNVIRSAMDVVEDYGDAAADVIRGQKTATKAIGEVES